MKENTKLLKELKKILKREKTWAREALNDSKYAYKKAQLAKKNGKILEYRDWKREEAVGRYWGRRRLTHVKQIIKKIQFLS